MQGLIESSQQSYELGPIVIPVFKMRSLERVGNSPRATQLGGDRARPTLVDLTSKPSCLPSQRWNWGIRRVGRQMSLLLN